MMKFRKIYYSISGILVLAGIVSIFVFHVPLGLDFKGGSLMQLEFTAGEGEDISVPSREKVSELFEEYELGAINIQSFGDDGIILKFKDIDETTHQELLAALRDEGMNYNEVRFESVGPVIGKETVEKSLKAIALVLTMIVIYVAWAFRKISYPIKSSRYGVIALVALFHDVIITVGIFSLFAYFTGAEAGVPFVAALLTILGYSVNDTIVIFDRVRENLIKFGDRISFEDIVSNSTKESVVRSINTSLTTLFVLAAIFIFGGATVSNFIFTLMVGVVVGTYSSLFLASPLLVSWASRR